MRVLHSRKFGFERGTTMIVFKREQKGCKTEVSVPNWVAALVLTVTILAMLVLLVKYLPDIVLWLG